MPEVPRGRRAVRRRTTLEPVMPWEETPVKPEAPDDVPADVALADEITEQNRILDEAFARSPEESRKLAETRKIERARRVAEAAARERDAEENVRERMVK